MIRKLFENDEQSEVIKAVCEAFDDNESVAVELKAEDGTHRYISVIDYDVIYDWIRENENYYDYDEYGDLYIRFDIYREEDGVKSVIEESLYEECIIYDLEKSMEEIEKYPDTYYLITKENFYDIVSDALEIIEDCGIIEEASRDAIQAEKEAELYYKDPYAYNGVSPWDFV